MLQSRAITWPRGLRLSDSVECGSAAPAANCVSWAGLGSALQGVGKGGKACKSQRCGKVDRQPPFSQQWAKRSLDCGGWLFPFNAHAKKPAVEALKHLLQWWIPGSRCQSLICTWRPNWLRIANFKMCHLDCGVDTASPISPFCSQLVLTRGCPTAAGATWKGFDWRY